MSFNSHTFEIARSLLNKESAFSLDYGHTLIKVVYIGKTDEKNGQNDKIKLHMESFRHDQMDEALDFIKNNVILKPGGTYLTSGMTAATKTDLIERTLNIKVTNVVETLACTRAVKFMKENFPEEEFTFPSAAPNMEGIEAFYAIIKTFQRTGGAMPVSWDESEPLSDSTMMLALGSGACLLKMNADGTFSVVDIIFSAGQTLSGMGRLLAGAKTHEELMSLASVGDLSNIHLCLPDLLRSYSDKTDLLESYSDKREGKALTGKDAVLMSYAKTNNNDHGDFKKEDLASAVLRSIVDNIVKVSYLACSLHKVKKLYMFGGMTESELVRTELTKSWAIETELGFRRPIEMKIMKNSGYLTAMGALLLNNNDDFDNLMESLMAQV